MLRFNREILGLQPSRSMTFMAKAKQLRAQDPEVVDLSGGEPDFDTPQKIRDELYRQVAAGYTHYTVGAGLPELRERIVKKLKEEAKRAQAALTEAKKVAAMEGDTFSLSRHASTRPRRRSLEMIPRRRRWWTQGRALPP